MPERHKSCRSIPRSSAHQRSTRLQPSSSTRAPYVTLLNTSAAYHQSARERETCHRDSPRGARRPRARLPMWPAVWQRRAGRCDAAPERAVVVDQRPGGHLDAPGGASQGSRGRALSRLSKRAAGQASETSRVLGCPAGHNVARLRLLDLLQSPGVGEALAALGAFDREVSIVAAAAEPRDFSPPLVCIHPRARILAGALVRSCGVSSWRSADTSIQTDARMSL